MFLVVGLAVGTAHAQKEPMVLRPVTSSHALVFGAALQLATESNQNVSGSHGSSSKVTNGIPARELICQESTVAGEGHNSGLS